MLFLIGILQLALLSSQVLGSSVKCAKPQASCKAIAKQYNVSASCSKFFRTNDIAVATCVRTTTKPTATLTTTKYSKKGKKTCTLTKTSKHTKTKTVRTTGKTVVLPKTVTQWKYKTQWDTATDLTTSWTSATSWHTETKTVTTTTTVSGVDPKATGKAQRFAARGNIRSCVIPKSCSCFLTKTKVQTKTPYKTKTVNVVIPSATVKKYTTKHTTCTRTRYIANASVTKFTTKTAKPTSTRFSTTTQIIKIVSTRQIDSTRTETVTHTVTEYLGHQSTSASSLATHEATYTTIATFATGTGAHAYVTTITPTGSDEPTRVVIFRPVTELLPQPATGSTAYTSTVWPAGSADPSEPVSFVVFRPLSKLPPQPATGSIAYTSTILPTDSTDNNAPIVIAEYRPATTLPLQAATGTIAYTTVIIPTDTDSLLTVIQYRPATTLPPQPGTASTPYLSTILPSDPADLDAPLTIAEFRPAITLPLQTTTGAVASTTVIIPNDPNRPLTVIRYRPVTRLPPRRATGTLPYIETIRPTDSGDSNAPIAIVEYVARSYTTHPISTATGTSAYTSIVTPSDIYAPLTVIKFRPVVTLPPRRVSSGGKFTSTIIPTDVSEEDDAPIQIVEYIPRDFTTGSLQLATGTVAYTSTITPADINAPLTIVGYRPVITLMPRRASGSVGYTSTIAPTDTSNLNEPFRIVEYIPRDITTAPLQIATGASAYTSTITPADFSAPITILGFRPVITLLAGRATGTRGFTSTIVPTGSNDPNEPFQIVEYLARSIETAPLQIATGANAYTSTFVPSDVSAPLILQRFRPAITLAPIPGTGAGVSTSTIFPAETDGPTAPIQIVVVHPAVTLPPREGAATSAYTSTVPPQGTADPFTIIPFFARRKRTTIFSYATGTAAASQTIVSPTDLAQLVTVIEYFTRHVTVLPPQPGTASTGYTSTSFPAATDTGAPIVLVPYFPVLTAPVAPGTAPTAYFETITPTSGDPDGTFTVIPHLPVVTGRIMIGTGRTAYTSTSFPPATDTGKPIVIFPYRPVTSLPRITRGSVASTATIFPTDTTDPNAPVQVQEYVPIVSGHATAFVTASVMPATGSTAYTSTRSPNSDDPNGPFTIIPYRPVVTRQPITSGSLALTSTIVPTDLTNPTAPIEVVEYIPVGSSRQYATLSIRPGTGSTAYTSTFPPSSNDPNGVYTIVPYRPVITRAPVTSGSVGFLSSILPTDTADLNAPIEVVEYVATPHFVTGSIKPATGSTAYTLTIPPALGDVGATYTLVPYRPVVTGQPVTSGSIVFVSSIFPTNSADLNAPIEVISYFPTGSQRFTIGPIMVATGTVAYTSTVPPVDGSPTGYYTIIPYRPIITRSAIPATGTFPYTITQTPDFRDSDSPFTIIPHLPAVIGSLMPATGSVAYTSTVAPQPNDPSGRFTLVPYRPVVTRQPVTSGSIAFVSSILPTNSADPDAPIEVIPYVPTGEQKFTTGPFMIGTGTLAYTSTLSPLNGDPNGIYTIIPYRPVITLPPTMGTGTNPFTETVPPSGDDLNSPFTAIPHFPVITGSFMVATGSAAYTSTIMPNSNDPNGRFTVVPYRPLSTRAPITSGSIAFVSTIFPTNTLDLEGPIEVVQYIPTGSIQFKLGSILPATGSKAYTSTLPPSSDDPTGFYTLVPYRPVVTGSAIPATGAVAYVETKPPAGDDPNSPFTVIAHLPVVTGAFMTATGSTAYTSTLPPGESGLEGKFTLVPYRPVVTGFAVPGTGSVPYIETVSPSGGDLNSPFTLVPHLPVVIDSFMPATGSSAYTSTLPPASDDPNGRFTIVPYRPIVTLPTITTGSVSTRSSIFPTGTSDPNAPIQVVDLVPTVAIPKKFTTLLPLPGTGSVAYTSTNLPADENGLITLQPFFPATTLPAKPWTGTTPSILTSLPAASDGTITIQPLLPALTLPAKPWTGASASISTSLPVASDGTIIFQPFLPATTLPAKPWTGTTASTSTDLPADEDGVITLQPFLPAITLPAKPWTGTTASTSTNLPADEDGIITLQPFLPATTVDPVPATGSIPYTETILPAATDTDPRITIVPRLPATTLDPIIGNSSVPYTSTRLPNSVNGIDNIITIQPYFPGSTLAPRIGTGSVAYTKQEVSTSEGFIAIIPYRPLVTAPPVPATGPVSSATTIFPTDATDPDAAITVINFVLRPSKVITKFNTSITTPYTSTIYPTNTLDISATISIITFQTPPAKPDTSCNNLGVEVAIYDNPYTLDLSFSSSSTWDYSFEYLGTVMPYGVNKTNKVGLPHYSGNSGFELVHPHGFYPRQPWYSNGPQFSLNYRGFFYASKTQAYTFKIYNVEEIVGLWVGDKALGNWRKSNCDATYVWIDGIPSRSYTVTLEAGSYTPIRWVYSNRGGGVWYDLDITGADGTNYVKSQIASDYLVTESCEGSTDPFPELGKEFDSGEKNCDNKGWEFGLFASPYSNTNTFQTAWKPEFFKFKTPSRNGTTTQNGLSSVDTLNQPISGLPRIGGPFASIYRAYFYAPYTSTYNFSLSYADDTADLWVGDKAFTNWTRANADAESRFQNGYFFSVKMIPLTAGTYYPIRLAVGDVGGAIKYQLAITDVNTGFRFVRPDLPSSAYIVDETCASGVQPFNKWGEEGPGLLPNKTCNNIGVEVAIFHNPLPADTVASADTYSFENYGTYVPYGVSTTTSLSIWINATVSTQKPYGFIPQDGVFNNGPTITLGYRGWFFAPVSQNYTFSIRDPNDVVGFWIGENAFSQFTTQNADILHIWPLTTAKSVVKTLNAGTYYPIRIMVANSNGATQYNFDVVGQDDVSYVEPFVPSPFIVKKLCENDRPYPAWGKEHQTPPAMCDQNSVVGSEVGLYANPYNNHLPSPILQLENWNPAYFKTRQPYQKKTVSYVGWKTLGTDSTSAAPYGMTRVPAGSAPATNQKGYFYAPYSRNYTFTIVELADDGNLWVGPLAYSGWTGANSQIHTWWQQPAKKYTIALQAGSYTPIRIVAGDNGGGYWVNLRIDDNTGFNYAKYRFPTNYIVTRSCDNTTAPPFAQWGAET
ncbi:hypothetical protein H072_11090 [Dactylellina haptotyla CBS 200.50]|uniref:PA14 domain-containing protein n=1 Tax=Dactylellina haptotyla (strain CBS 200.50) TaxID=1284197 RepID=S7ZXT0_DACHA|nr:hypothetical protein H072_11090 [Dactylellina haptotyla CBS 200.50]